MHQNHSTYNKNGGGGAVARPTRETSLGDSESPHLRSKRQSREELPAASAAPARGVGGECPASVPVRGPRCPRRRQPTRGQLHQCRRRLAPMPREPSASTTPRAAATVWRHVGCCPWRRRS